MQRKKLFYMTTVVSLALIFTGIQQSNAASSKVKPKLKTFSQAEIKSINSFIEKQAIYIDSGMKPENKPVASKEQKVIATKISYNFCLKNLSGIKKINSIISKFPSVETAGVETFQHDFLGPLSVESSALLKNRQNKDSNMFDYFQLVNGQKTYYLGLRIAMDGTYVQRDESNKPIFTMTLDDDQVTVLTTSYPRGSGYFRTDAKPGESIWVKEKTLGPETLKRTADRYTELQTICTKILK